jgi:hypothetical protein
VNDMTIIDRVFQFIKMLLKTYTLDEGENIFP